LNPTLHILIALMVGILASKRPPLRPGWIRAAGLLTLAPVPVVLLLGPDELWITDKEGLIEAVTAGLLLAVALGGWWAGARVLSVAAGVLLLEELDYGQALLGFSTPEYLSALGSKSTHANLHNLPGSSLWRLVPLAGLLALSRPSIAARAARLGLPGFRPVVWQGVALMVVCAVCTGWFVGEDRLDESVELAAVALVWSSWLIPAREHLKREP